MCEMNSYLQYPLAICSKRGQPHSEINILSFDRFIRPTVISFLHLLFFKLQISISQTTDFHLANYRFPFRKLQILSSFHKLYYRLQLCFVSQSNQNFSIGNLPSLLCNVSSNSFFCGIWEKRPIGSASLLQLSCVNRTVPLFFLMPPSLS